MQSLDQLNQRFASANRFITFDKCNGGLVRAVVKSPKAEAHVYLHGAHVSHFAKTGEPPVLLLSAKSSFEPPNPLRGGAPTRFPSAKPLRGGVPICFPWFGARAGHPDSPMHGFARLSEWTVESAESRGD